jgi:hypothetical protein
MDETTQTTQPTQVISPYHRQHKYIKKRYHADPEFREKYKAVRREYNHRMCEDGLTYQQHKTNELRERYQNDPEYRAEKLAKNRAYRERIKEAAASKSNIKSLADTLEKDERSNPVLSESDQP